MLIILMGVSGSGKTLIGEMLAKELGWEFFDADNFHTPANKKKMSEGIPLTDEDRIPWLRQMHEEVKDAIVGRANKILCCSALKDMYREILIGEDSKENSVNVKIVLLHGSREILEERLKSRRGHFFNPVLLTSQLETLEIPSNAHIVDINPPPATIISHLLSLPFLSETSRNS